MKRTAILHIACLLITASMIPANAATYTWTNSSGGSFSTAGNWSPSGGPPVSGDLGYFDATGTAATYTVSDIGTISVGRLYSSAKDAVTLAGSGSSSLAVGWLMPTDGTFTLDSGSTTVSTVLYVGNSGTGNLVLQNSATLTVNSGVASNFRVAGNGTSSGNTLIVKGGSQLLSYASGGILVGSSGVASGGNNLVSVEGTGSLLSGTGSPIYVGSNSDNNTMRALSGGDITTNVYTRIGAASGVKNNVLRVDGAGSSFALSANVTLEVGHSGGTAENNRIEVVNSGSFTSAGSLLLQSTSGTVRNQFNVSSNGTANLNNTSNTIGGQLSVAGGTLNANGLTMTSGGLISYTSGTIAVTGNVSTNGGQFDFNLDSDLTINISGTFSASGTASYVNILNDMEGTPGSYTLFTFASGTGLSNLLLGTLPSGMVATLEKNATNVVLNVTAIPEPTAAALVIFGLTSAVSLAVRRRRQSRT